MKKLVNGRLVDLTADEQTARQAEEAQGEKDALKAYAYSQKSRTTAPITLTIQGGERTFTPTDLFSSRLNNTYQTTGVAGVASSNWIFDNGVATITRADMEAMATATYNQWQPYFDAIATVIANIEVGTTTTKAQIDAAFDVSYGV